MGNFKTRAVGEVFRYADVILKVEESDFYCGDCHFHIQNTKIDPPCIYKTNQFVGYCNSEERSDKLNVIFKKLSTVNNINN